MPAHLREIPDRRCPICASRARYEVLDTWNGHVGFYCRKHAEQQIRKLNEATVLEPEGQ
jgi:hypothetical protein